MTRLPAPVIPKALPPGSTLAVVSPAAPSPPEQLEQGL
jgi:hypothetical protein